MRSREGIFMTKRIWGTPERKLNSYNCGWLHTYYESMGTIVVKEEIQFPTERANLLLKYYGRINP